MDGYLEQALASEHDLLGSISDEEILGALDRAPARVKKAFVAKAKANNTKAIRSSSNRSRGEFERRIALLPPEIQRGLANKTLQAADTSFYIVKGVAGTKVIKMLKDDDNKVVGLSNISSGKLEKGNYMLLWGVQLLAGDGVVGEGGVKQAYQTKFDIIPDWLKNGEFELKANGTVLIPNSAMSVFDSTTRTSVDRGLYVLDNPKMIKDQQAIEFNLEWNHTAPADFFVKAIFRGTTVIKA